MGLMTRAALQEHIANNGGELFIAAVADQLWASNRYWLIPVAQAPFADLLAWWNLPLAPGSYGVAERVWLAADRTPPKMKNVLDLELLTEMTLARVFVPRQLAVRFPIDRQECTVLGSKAGDKAVVRTDYLALVTPDWESGSTSFKGAGDGSPVAIRDAAGRTGFVMPLTVR